MHGLKNGAPERRCNNEFTGLQWVAEHPQFRYCGASAKDRKRRLLWRTAGSNDVTEAHMPLYLIERNFAEKLDINADGIAAISKINGEIGVNWLFSFLSADKRKSYCLYEAKDPEAIREAARRANVPADVIMEVHQTFGADPRVLAPAG
ncbi:DUF4242 domain-containing protein [Variovorax guangxiensis]|uniref:DUF4242 domain-containing protein n=1 Tax=Variovorax guangxiensis TaxID=1775474 RepID=UPI00285C4C97|nr:DUF4242 domain-containing protein [Variovorax guangxiensis]MDR6860142.1 hypothetical protein [Variovorax guangxiensis]